MEKIETPHGGGGGDAITPLDTPADWHDRIAQRAREWRELGPAAALSLWRSRDGLSQQVHDTAANVHGATPQARA